MAIFQNSSLLRTEHFILIIYPFEEGADVFGGDLALYSDQVFLPDAVARMRQAQGKLAIVGIKN